MTLNHIDFYLINQDFNLLTQMEEIGFTGNLFPYNPLRSDFFTKIARDLDIHKKIKYMVAIRPYVLSPEYLVKIHKSIIEISKENRLQINLVSGNKDFTEQKMSKTLGQITNKSNTKEKSNHFIEYIDLLSQIPQEEKPDYYVSVTNNFTFETASKYNNKIIIQYHQYINNQYNISDKQISDKQVMMYFKPIIRKTQEELDNLNGYEGVIEIPSEYVKFTYDQLTTIIDKLRSKGITQIMFSAWFSIWNKKDIKEILNFVKEYNHKI